jgi:outer membrane protein assembly factor BamB
VVLAIALVGFAGCGDSGSSSEANSAKHLKAPPGPRRPLPNPAHTGYLPAPSGELDPPLREGETITTDAPFGVPPVIANGIAYIVSQEGKASAMALDSGEAYWEKEAFPIYSTPAPEATAPISDDGQLVIVSTEGNETVLNEESGKFAWTFDANSYVSAAPVVVKGITYLIANKTNLIALKEGIQYEASGLGTVEPSPSYHSNRFFVANETGSVISLGIRSGEILWRTETRNVPGLGEAGFSQSPAVAFGHVYAARDDGAVVALEEKSGKVAWFATAGPGVSGPAAVAKVPGAPPTVYVGSKDGGLYAFEAKSGKRLWRYDVGEPLLGPVGVVGHTAYLSTADETIGVDVRTGKKSFELSQGPLTPIATDGGHVYMAGEGELVSLEPAGR